jgi:hypothetical protein
MDRGRSKAGASASRPDGYALRRENKQTAGANRRGYNTAGRRLLCRRPQLPARESIRDLGRNRKACNFKDFNEYVDKKPYFAYTEHGQTVVIFRTWIGDGIYADQESREYPVDSGMIGVVPVAMAHPDESRCSWTEYPDVKRFHRLTFAEPFLCKREDDGGLLVFGNVEIDTAGFWAAAAEIARGYTFVVWDWKQQIDVEELNAALQKIPGAVVTAVDTGVDAFALVVHTPTLQKTAEEWEELYHEEEEEQEEEADASGRY